MFDQRGAPRGHGEKECEAARRNVTKAAEHHDDARGRDIPGCSKTRWDELEPALAAR